MAAPMIVDPNRARQREALIDTLRWQLHLATGKTLAILPPRAALPPEIDTHDLELDPDRYETLHADDDFALLDLARSLNIDVRRFPGWMLTPADGVPPLDWLDSRPFMDNEDYA